MKFRVQFEMFEFRGKLQGRVNAGGAFFAREFELS